MITSTWRKKKKNSLVKFFFVCTKPFSFSFLYSFIFFSFSLSFFNTSCLRRRLLLWQIGRKGVDGGAYIYYIPLAFHPLPIPQTLSTFFFTLSFYLILFHISGFFSGRKRVNNCNEPRFHACEHFFFIFLTSLSHLVFFLFYFIYFLFLQYQ